MNTTDINESVRLLSKTFAANESVVVNIESLGLGDDLGILTIENNTGLSAQFLWQKNVSYASKGYFKEIKNDLGATVAHHDGIIAITNGGVEQYLEADLKN
ncbi:hypothetical protein [Chryseobacterium sp. JUb7]|uniref:hypothetical protein n=1 Tax=Chryseobacterium sp. JUb7 TaxID=2940599 RepID=UPI0021670244|nr:hypothetical protein [Chryseobacterium sp. JUb7]MCS3530107.1 hypothetical protein [Chryseobacterium sp. JUb7]